MTDRDNRSTQGQGGSHGSNPNPGSKSSNPGGKSPQRESEQKPGQSKQTQGNPNPPRDSHGQFESGRSGSQGQTGSKKGSDTEEENE